MWPVSRCSVNSEVVEDGAGGRDAARHVVDAESLERRGAELLAELLAVDLLREDPFVEPVGVVLRSEGFGEALLAAALVDDLLGREVRDELVDVGVRPFGHVELARGDVQKGHARRPAAEVDRAEVGVLLVGEDVVTQDDARGHQLDDAALDEPLDELRVLELLADGHALTRTHQLGQVGVDGMIGESRQLDEGGGAVGAARERDAQDAAGLDRVVAERLVEVAHAEEQDGVGMHRLDGVILLHERRLDIFFGVGLLFRSHRLIVLFHPYKDSGIFRKSCRPRIKKIGGRGFPSSEKQGGPCANMARL